MDSVDNGKKKNSVGTSNGRDISNKNTPPSGSVKTSDENNLGLYFILAMISAGGVMYMIRKSKEA
ncbi:sortase B protein-sorting domain-containing protein [uncultured Anaerofustis sp.]|uniref:sortase B protein-sorting domain-containing protein n=1 Tax=uncultured Anaerofustis sp. TaxID=904996 RepID=UPI0025E4DAD2|nr:sortase B protein-sorting domain-containing protein [uncultured Anaerofustis sp.]